MDIDIRIGIVEDEPVEGWSTVTVGPGYSTRIRGVFPSIETNTIELFIIEAVSVAIRLARLENEAEAAEERAAAQSGGGD